MRIRYQFVGDCTYSVACDLPDKKAKAEFERLKKDGFCEWAELVGEDDENYMDILDQFDKTDEARKLYKVFSELFK